MYVPSTAGYNVHDDKVFWILWNPESKRPPTRPFYEKSEAERVAKDMAERHGGHFFVLEVKGVAFSPPKPKTTYKKIPDPLAWLDLSKPFWQKMEPPYTISHTNKTNGQTYGLERTYGEPF